MHSYREEETLSAEPLIRPASLAALAAESVPAGAHFRRDHFLQPLVDRDTWRLEVSGTTGRKRDLTLEDVRSYPRRELRVVLECAGHRRNEYSPSTRGVPWGVGAISEAVWAGTSLGRILEDVDTDGARFVLLEGADRGPFGGSPSVPFARALPLEKALHPDTLLAWEMNGEPLPPGHGAPLRAIVPGWYGTDSIKWLHRIVLLDKPFAGPFEADEYRLRSSADSAGERLTTLAVNSLITSHHDRERVAPGFHSLTGIAWGGVDGVARVEVSTDGGDWQDASVRPSEGDYAFARWSLGWHAQAGLRTIAVRASDGTGDAQPQEPTWNEGGYANSSIQRIRLLVE